MSTIIDQPVLKKIEAHLTALYPNEACGFLLGTESDGHRRITHEIEVENHSTENRQRRFVIDPTDYLKAEKFAAREGLTLLGIYHSHPDHPAIPSIHDLEYAQPFFSYFIHSIREGVATETKVYRLVAETFAEEPLTISTPQPVVS